VVTGNIAPRNSWSQAKANYYGGTQQNAAASRCGPWDMQITFISRLPAKTGSQMATRNSCRELVMPMEKHQPHGRLPGRGLLPAAAV